MLTRQTEVVGLLEKLSSQVAASSPGGGGEQRHQANQGYYLRVLSSHLPLSETAVDEFATLQQAKRRLIRACGDAGREKAEALCSQLDELHRKMRSPALAPLLSRRWALLHTLVSLSNPSAKKNAGASASSEDDLIRSFTSASPAFWAGGLPRSTLLSQGEAASGIHQDGGSRNASSLHSSSSFMSEPGRASSVASANRGPLVPRGGHENGMRGEGQEEGPGLLSGEELGLLRDLLFVFQGIDGQSIKYDAAAQMHVLGPQLSVSPATKDELLRMAELGWLFRRVQAFIDTALLLQQQQQQQQTDAPKLGAAGGQQCPMGLVGQAFCYVLQEEVTEYYRLISILESQLTEDGISLLQQQQHQGQLPAAVGGLTLKRLAVWVEEPLEKMRVLATLCDSLSVVRGGAMASVLFAHTKQGDPLVKTLVQRITGRVSQPIFDMIRSWILEGELDDRYGEFFVEVRLPDLPDADERLWHHKYALRPRMLPRFISKDLAAKILVIGKSINFMRRCCKDKEWVSSQLKSRFETDGLLSYETVDALQQVVDSIAQVVNERLLHLLMGRYQLMTHFRALKKFMMLGQGDFVTCLMDMIGQDLSKMSTQVYRHDLTGKLEAALRSSNAQFEQVDILNRVGVRLLEPSAGEDGWDVFSLDYQVEAPVSAVIHSEASDAYSRLFHLLWRVKRIEWSLAASWKQHMLVAHGQGGGNGEVPLFRSILHRCNLARGEMMHFVSNLSNFIMFAVLETSWTELQRCVVEDARDLDGIIRAHDTYLHTILDKAFLAQDKYALHNALLKVLNVILQFCNMHHQLCLGVVTDRWRRREFQHKVDLRTAAGQWGMTRDEEEALWRASRQLLDEYECKAEALTADYQAAFHELMTLLQQHEGDSSDAVRFLVFTLDFNEFYGRSRRHQGGPQRYTGHRAT